MAETWSVPQPRDGSTVVQFEGTRFRMPVRWPDADGFAAIFPASLDAVLDLLPSDDLVPVQWLDGSALVVVQAMRVNVFAVRLEDGPLRLAAPFGMVLVGVVVARGDPGYAPIALRPRQVRRHQVGALELLLPLTSGLGAAVGIEMAGEPKLVADLAFLERRGERAVTVSEDGRRLLTLAVRPSGPVLRYTDELSLYTAADRQLRRMAMPSRGHRQVRLGRGAARLDLGEHPAVAPLRSLGVSSRPVVTTSYVDFAFDQHAPELVGPAGSLPAPAAERTGPGRYTVDFEGLGVVDLHAGLSEEWLRGGAVVTP
jgi:hypothetical protein